MHPILDVADVKISSLFVVCIGCDLFPGIDKLLPM